MAFGLQRGATIDEAALSLLVANDGSDRQSVHMIAEHDHAFRNQGCTR